MNTLNHHKDKHGEWRSKLAMWIAGFLLFETLSGLSIWLLPFSVTNQVAVLVHTVAGILFLLPCLGYLIRHWRVTRGHFMTHIKLTGYIGALVWSLCTLSGVVLTLEAAFGTRINYVWDGIHIVTTVAIVAFLVPHILLIVTRAKSTSAPEHRAIVSAARAYGVGLLTAAIALCLVVALAAYAYEPVKLKQEFNADYSYPYGPDRPFAPSLATTETGGLIDSRALSGSKSCGTAQCHEQIVREWESSAHRYSAMDVGFQRIQLTMAKQNGPESTRYCGGCHDPISLFSGTKNLFTEEEKLTTLSGYQEGVSCLTCHSVRKTDLKGNAHYVMTQPRRYMFELEYNQTQSEWLRFLRDFQIRAYPRHHVDSLSKRLFKTPEYCAACHKQFIDKEINNVGWVQLQNQFDNWRKSKWNSPNDPTKTIECRECHMPLMQSSDPAAGDSLDYNRTENDGKHRSHRFVAANQFMPRLLKTPGWEEHIALTEEWLKGEYEIPEIADKWARGPAVSIELITPERVHGSEQVSLKTVITSNKVGHDFPTGPLDIIQAWVEIVVTDDQGKVVFSTGTVDDQGFIAAGSFIFKAEPVDQYGKLIDRHNLWEMVGVRQRRALFPGFSDTAEFDFFCPDLYPRKKAKEMKRREVRNYALDIPAGVTGRLHVAARLKYRKMDQYLLNFVFGKEAGVSSPITEMSSDQKTIEVVGNPGPASEVGG